MATCAVQSWNNREPEHKLIRPCIDPEKNSILKISERKAAFEKLLESPLAKNVGAEVSVRFIDDANRLYEVKRSSDGSYKTYRSLESKIPKDSAKFLAYNEYAGPLNGELHDVYIDFDSKGAPSSGSGQKGILTGPTTDLMNYVKLLDAGIKKKLR